MSDTLDVLTLLEEMGKLGRQIPCTPYRRLNKAVGRVRVALAQASTVAIVAGQRERKDTDARDTDRWLNRQRKADMLMMTYGLPPADLAR